MFTGIVEELGTVKSVREAGGGARIEIGADAVLDGLEPGASVAVNGCCLTVVDLQPGTWAADAVIETLRRTNLGTLGPGDPVNLERPVPAGGRLDGHIVQGHVDGTGTVAHRNELPDGSFDLRVETGADLLRYVVEKGSIALDGVSLTVVSVDDEGFHVALIPHTAEVTTLGHRSAGDRVNLEVDLVAKYVERLLRPYRQPTENP